MRLKEEFKYRVDEDKLVDAVNAAHFLANNFLETGRYNVDESWGPEGLLYLAESAYALMSMYEVDSDQLYVRCCQINFRSTEKNTKAKWWLGASSWVKVVLVLLLQKKKEK
jgi:hypothetical protein